MDTLSKVRFFLVTTSLLAAFQAQSMAPEPTTVLQVARIAPAQPQKETKGHFLALPDGLMALIAANLSPEDFVALSRVNKRIRTDIASVLPWKQAEHLVRQTNRSGSYFLYAELLETIQTKQGRDIMETLARRGKGLRVATGIDPLIPYVTTYKRTQEDSLTPVDILASCPHLVELNLGSNQIGDTGAQALLDALRDNKQLSLKKLILWGNDISEELQNQYGFLAGERGFEVRFLEPEWLQLRRPLNSVVRFMSTVAIA